MGVDILVRIWEEREKVPYELRERGQSVDEDAERVTSGGEEESFVLDAGGQELWEGKL